MAPFEEIMRSNLRLPPNSYIYKMQSTAPRQDPLTYTQTDQLAFISSDDSLRILDPNFAREPIPVRIIEHVNQSVTCLESADHPQGGIVVTAGRDGFVNFWDKRSQNKIISVKSPEQLISSVVCNMQQNFLAAGIENPDDGTGVSPVYVWDQRNIQKPLLELVESHTDTVTSLQLHPSLPTLLLSSSTDGLVNIFDISKPDEEEALYQVINHRSAVAHAGFMFPSTDIYALGTDETMSFYTLQSQEEEEEEPAPKAFGDVREQLGCDSSSLDLIPIERNPRGSPLQYEFDLQKSIQIPGAHDGEIVRDIFTDVHSHTTYTCGEDGTVRGWKFPSEEGMSIEDNAEPVQKKLESKKVKRKERKEKRKGDADEGKVARYKPY
ncbi:WD40-repeat-containing domain protein [Massariosphaeria phaeospora]|uniref:WD40-repeat-containing domain protein n=1 Tax=Massariosphaeria phaeospora TaxID=100035 RepID=A0A7C8I8Z7_9PLEO|nr:WD40-repeat-containing domain protein [Massariosphaeria phaeospora]